MSLRKTIWVGRLDVSAWLRKNLSVWLLAGCGVAVFALTYFSPATSAGADPHLTLLVSQAIVEQGTIKLDAYADRAQPPLYSYSADAAILKYQGHYYYYYPLGTSVMAVPFVWVANLLGKDMALTTDNHQLQNLLSALTVVAVFFLVFAICRSYLGQRASLVITVISILGSVLVSTLGTALWSINLGALFVSLALLLITRYDRGRSATLHPYLLGFSLFAAYFCRASTASFVLAALVYLLATFLSGFVPNHFQRSRLSSWRPFAAFLVFWQGDQQDAERRDPAEQAVRNPRAASEAVRAMACSLMLLLAFLAFSWIEYGNLVPQYYSVVRFQAHRAPLLLVLYGHLLSPSRGLLVFDPFLGLVLGGTVWLFRRLRQRHLFWFVVIWLSVQFISVSGSTRWWGGYSFGPRLLAEVIPGFVLLTAMLWSAAASEISALAKRLVVVCYLLFGMAGLMINGYQGLMNLDTAMWNGPLPPDIDRHPEYLLDWEFPQFLATRVTVCQRNAEYSHDGLKANAERLRAYAPGDTITFDSGQDDIRDDDRQTYQQAFQLAAILERLRGAATPRPIATPVAEGGANALFIGWSPPEGAPGFRWSECPSPEIAFRLGSVDTTHQYVLEISAGSFGLQEPILWLNGAELGTLIFPGPHVPPITGTLPFEGQWLISNGVNILRLEIPAAQTASPSDPRAVGLAFVSLRIRPQQGRLTCASATGGYAARGVVP